MTFALAKAVGESGRVFTNELNKDRVKAIEREAEKSGVKNVTVVEGREAETNFPDQCCDAIFMRNVYHHFGDPPAMNASLLKSLKPGGRLAVIDFTPPPPSDVSENPPGRRGEDNHHGITLATLAERAEGRRLRHRVRRGEEPGRDRRRARPLATDNRYPMTRASYRCPVVDYHVSRYRAHRISDIGYR